MGPLDVQGFFLLPTAVARGVAQTNLMELGCGQTKLCREVLEVGQCRRIVKCIDDGDDATATGGIGCTRGFGTAGDRTRNYAVYTAQGSGSLARGYGRIHMDAPWGISHKGGVCSHSSVAWLLDAGIRNDGVALPDLCRKQTGPCKNGDRQKSYFTH